MNATIAKYNTKYNAKFLFIVLIFVLGLYYYMNSSKLSEPMSDNYSCPNMLIEKDGSYYLYNSKKAIVPGVNPVQFNNLEEYAEFVEWQNSQNINCPILYLQYTTDTQNNDLLQIKPSIFENQGGLPASKSATLDEDYFEENKMLDATKNSTPNSNIKLNSGMYAGFDQGNQNIGLDTPLDKLFNEKNTDGQSRNPMDTNWGGKKHTKSALERGDYKDREVKKYVT